MPVISDERWERAMEQLRKKYLRSDNLEACINLLEQFDKVSPKKYYTDLEGYLREVRFEDFYSSNKGEICVSTIHKSKGRNLTGYI